MSLRPDYASTLHEHPFFANFSQPLIKEIAGYVYHREYEPRQIVYFPDDACDHAYWVRDGRIKVTRVSGDGRELTFRHLLPGDMFGEECLGDAPRRNDYAEAMANTVLCLMRAADFRRLAREHAPFSHLLAVQLCRRTQETEQVLAEAVFSPVRSRVASGLLRLFRRECQAEGDAIRVTHHDVANLAGSTRETTTAVLHQLREEGLVRLANRRVIVLDPVALEHVAASR